MYGLKQCDPINGCGEIYDSELIKCPKCNTPDQFSSIVPFNNRDVIYDLECYPNVFTGVFKHARTGTKSVFEISPRRNDLNALVDYLNYLRINNFRMVGFNNIGYDYPLIHLILQRHAYRVTIDDIYRKSQSIINAGWDNRFGHIIWDNDRIIEQLDLMKIHHFDNKARATSLKMMEFVLRAESIIDLPFDPTEDLDVSDIPTLLFYNDYDVEQTARFYMKSIKQIEFREKLTEKYNRNFINHNDTKIGKDYFIMRLEEEIPGSCYYRTTEGKKPRQTHRPVIHLRNVIFDYIKFEQPEFNRVKNWLQQQKIAGTETKGIYTDLTAHINGFDYDFGLGGIHGSVESSVIISNDEYMIVDIDVKSYYPKLAIENNLYPEHLSKQFCVIYEDVYNDRISYDKGTPENAMLKLALNGTYGETNNIHSCFYDPEYTMSVTINGQLLLCMLAEQLIKIPCLRMIQINTDGLTVKLHRQDYDFMKSVCVWWESVTKLTLEYVEYKRMFIRDVNNYLAQDCDGNIKRKGAYEYELEYHKDHSQLVVPKAAEAYLLYDIPPEHYVRSHPDIYDFMLRTKISGSDKLYLHCDIWNSVKGDIPQQKITRYAVTNTGGNLYKISAPAKGHRIGDYKRANKLTDKYFNQIVREIRQPDGSVPWDERIHTKNKSKYENRKTGISSGHRVTTFNDKIHHPVDLNYEYYINEVKKLTNCFM